MKHPNPIFIIQRCWKTFSAAGHFFAAVVCCLALLLPLTADAKHIIGGDMTYRFVEDLGGGLKVFEFTLVIYRDCDSGGGLLDNPASIGIFLGDQTSALLDTSILVSTNDIQFVDPVIPPCADVSAVSNACVQRGIYVFTLILKEQLIDNYIIVYQRCCRTDQIVNIINPDQFGATYMVEITPEAFAMNNSSPVFTNYPPTFICNNLPLNFDHGATDADGDSLVYAFCTPLTGGGQGGGNCDSPVPTPPCPPPFDQVVFTGIYSQDVPMGGSPLVTVDTMSGLLTGTPFFLGQFVVGICVKEYRNGQLIGSILRDFQFNVVDCASSVVADMEADQILGPKQFLIKRCGQKVITILNKSPQTNDLLNWEWEVDLGGGNIFISNAWNLTVVLPDYGEYAGRLFLNRGSLGCSDSAYITLRAYPGVVAAFSESWDICLETPVVFADSSVSGATTGGIVSWQWTFGPLVPPTTQASPVITFPAYGTYLVRLQVIDSDGCKDDHLLSLVWEPKLPPVIPPLSPQLLCVPAPAIFPLLDSFDITGSHVVWDFGDGEFAYDVANPLHIYEPGIYTMSLAVTTPYGCFSTDTFVNTALVYASPVAGFRYLPKNPSNLDNTLLFTNLSDASAVLWSWTFGSFGTSQQFNPLYTFPDTGLVPVVLMVSNVQGCMDTLTQIVDIVPKVQLYIPNVFAPGLGSSNGNDRFGILGILPGYTNYRMTIWSRWGEMLFETNDAQETWDGRRMGSSKLMPKGVYIYSIRFTGPRGEPFEYEGSITLL